MAKLRRRHLDDLSAKLENLSDRIVEVRKAVAREAEIRVMTTRQEPQLADFERVAALLTGVRVALERMGGTTLPAFREDVQALRHDISRLGTDLAGYAADRIKQVDNPEPAFREDVQALRHEMGQYHHEMASLNGQLPKVMNFIEALHIQHTLDHPQPAIKQPKRRGRRDKAALEEAQQLGLMDQWRDQLDRDVAETHQPEPHAETPEPKRQRRGPGRPKKDTSQKLMDEPMQEVVEE